ncbi:hypothetical protein [Hyphococcus sp.]|uniref:hypothetical protein n=1 Tax=Hyphococcus sp. TaxID=2038636 RepID=UPI00208B0612|nr:MAG: hypothetical protein DHS20C04_01180 [Marinicaulis sp.]
MADLSEHFGRSGELLIGFFGLFLLALMHKDVRRFLACNICSAGGIFQKMNAALYRKSRFYADWASAFQVLFHTSNNLVLIVIALTVFDYLAGWHSAFMLDRFSLYPDFSTIEDYDYLGQLRTTVFSAANAFGLLRVFGYTLFCWLAFRVAAGDSYQSAATFRPYRRILGLFLCIYGTDIFASAATPYVILFGVSIVGDISSLIFITGALIISMLFCLLGGRLVNTHLNGAISKPAISAIIGFLLLTHTLQWIYFTFDRATLSQSLFLREAEYHAENLTYTLLLNIALVAFAIRLSGPPRSMRPVDTGPHNPANAV